MLPADEPEGISLLQLTQELCEMEAITLEALKLKSGILLRLQSLVQNGPAIEVAFFAILNKHRVLLGLPGASFRESHLEIGERCLVRGFNGSHSFSFESNVLDLQEWPFVQAHLEYPSSIEYPGRQEYIPD